MKNSRRDKGLDELLGKEVEIVFFDGKQRTGILSFNDFGVLSFYPGHYRIDSLCFRKSHVQKYRQKGAAVWLKIKK